MHTCLPLQLLSNSWDDMKFVTVLHKDHPRVYILGSASVNDILSKLQEDR
jgi:hypothetical protein